MGQAGVRNAAVLACMLAGSACAGLLPGGQIAECGTGMLAAQASGGEACLETLQQRPRFARWMAENGAPDYIEPTGSGTIRFFYIERDAVVSFGTGWLSSDEPAVDSRIRSGDHVRFSDADRARLGRVRLREGAVPEADDDAPGGGVRRARVGADD